MSITIASSVVLSDVCIGSGPAHVSHIGIAIASVLLLAVVISLVGLSFNTLRWLSGQEDGLLELLEDDDF